MKSHDLKDKLIENLKESMGSPELSISAFANFFSVTKVDSARKDALYYCSGKRLWDDDPESREKEIIVLECNRKIEFNLKGTEFFMLTLCLEFPLNLVSSVSTFQSGWCLDKMKIQEWLAEVQTDPLFLALKKIEPQNVSYFAFPVKV